MFYFISVAAGADTTESWLNDPKTNNLKTKARHKAGLWFGLFSGFDLLTSDRKKEHSLSVSRQPLFQITQSQMVAVFNFFQVLGDGFVVHGDQTHFLQ